MAETWPATVPTDISIAGFSESPPDNLIRTPMGVGPDKVRRRTTANIRPLSGKIIMTGTELAAFDTFYVTTLASGALTFNFAHPRTGTTEEMRFVTVPQYTPSPRGGDYWDVSMELEVLP